MPPQTPGEPHPPEGADRTSHSPVLRRSFAARRWVEYLAPLADLTHDLLLLSIIAACVLVVGFQLLVIVLQPTWSGPVTDWLRAALAWPELLILVTVSLWLSRHRRLEAVTWWLFTFGVVCYAIARTWWTVDDALIYHHGVPFPILPDLFFVLQYPFYILAVILIPLGGVLGPRLLAVLDALLWIVAATALSWYFLLAPFFAASGLSPLAKAISLGYPAADLFLFLALVLILLRQLRYREDRPVLGIVIAAVICLLVADSEAILLILHPAHEYRTGQLPDLFWLMSDLLIPLAAVVQVRMVQQVLAGERRTPVDSMMFPGRRGPEAPQVLEWTDVRAALRLFLPLVAALLASVAILLRAAITATTAGTWESLLAPLVVSATLLLLVIVRQSVVFVEMVQLRRVVVAAQAEEQALRALDRRKDEFLSVVSHEMRTPLSSLAIFFELLARRFDSLFTVLPSREEGIGGAVGNGGSVGEDEDRDHPRERQGGAGAQHAALVHAQASVRRLTRLTDDLVDDSRIRHGRLALRLEPCDLATIVAGAVDEQCAAEPDRTILLEVSGAGDQPGQQAQPGQQVPVLADADRIAQVITNYLTNALKYSAAGRPVAVRLEVVAGARKRADGAMQGSSARGGGDGERDLARVSVHDEGIGVPLAAQAQVWERFHTAEGNTVQTGSGTSLGLGLHICKTIIEDHNGQVGVQSVPGQGSTFWFTLPLAPSTSPPLSTVSSATSPGAD